ncbi:hypothetical protein LCGC14_1504550, partial [marine sediment metagenome]
FNDSSSNPNSPTGFELLNELKISEYSSNFASTGENMNITLHQSYVNRSFDTIVNTSIINGNNFTLPSPIDTYFNSTYTNITVKDIIAPNKTIIIEDQLSSWQSIDLVTVATSFVVPSKSYLTNLSVYVGINDPEGNKCDLRVRVLKSQWVSGENEPDSSVATISSSGQMSFSSYIGWLNNFSLFSSMPVLLDPSITANNTFYIEITDLGADSDGMLWRYADDNPPTNIDDSNSYSKSGPNWNFIVNGFNNVDLNLIYDITPLNNTPNPEDIGLKINGEIVNGYVNINGTGYWESSIVNGSNSGILTYNVSAEWWDVECNITQVQINYTKTDLKASSTFQIAGSGQDVNWNVTRNGGLNYFGTDFSNYKINFSIPATWLDSSIKVFNGSIEFSINKRLLGNGYREIEVSNARNGTFWFLNATSSNLISSIDTYVEGVAKNDIANYTNIVRFNTTFTETVDNGNLNLSVYSPSPNYLNHTNIVDISLINPDTEFNVSDWDISNDVAQYGVFTSYLAWNNGTAAGFLMGNLTIIGETELKFINLPSLTFDADEIFNITAFFNDTGYVGVPPKNISDALVSYSINSNSYRTANITVLNNGLYNITFNCNDSEFNSNGPNTITINASKQYYYNQSETLNIIILGKTSLTVINPQDGANFDSSDSFNITVKYNNTIRSEIINSPYINYSLDGGNNYRWDNINPIGNNEYNITIYCNDTQFGNYGLQNIIVNASTQYYYNQSKSFSITITGNTALTFNRWPNQSFYYSDETFNVTAYYFDTSRNQALTGATINVNIQGEGVYANKYISEIGNGYYNITVNCSESVFNRYGSFTFQINGSKLNYYDYINSSFNMIIGNTSLLILSPLDGSVFSNSQIINITVQYSDVVKNQGIVNAEINYTLNGGIDWKNDNITYIGQGKYNITIDCNNTDFVSYGPNTIKINASKQYYNNLSKSVNILILSESTLTILSPLNGAAFDSANTFNITVKYNNSIRNEIISNPSINYSLDGGNSYRYDNIESIGNNMYNITVDCNDNDFGNYGLMNIIINTSKQFYYNQSDSFAISITGNTSLTLSKWPNKAFYYLNEIFNITANFNDTSRNQEITGAIIEVDVDGIPYITTPVYVGNGNYNITINCSRSIFSNYGQFNIRINASKINYHNKSDSSINLIIGITSLTLLSPLDGSVFNTDQVFNIIIQYDDLIKLEGISGAIIMYSLNEGISYRGDNVTYIGSGQYNITVYASHSDFNKFGFLDL